MIFTIRAGKSLDVLFGRLKTPVNSKIPAPTLKLSLALVITPRIAAALETQFGESPIVRHMTSVL